MLSTQVRGLREKQTAIKRITAVVIDNMSKLVENPIEAAPFLPLLLPALEKAADSVADPEARAVCDRALKQLTRLNNEILKVMGKKPLPFDPPHVPARSLITIHL